MNFTLQDQTAILSGRIFYAAGAFGDWGENHRINDLSISDNADRDKVLATVAATFIDFMEDQSKISFCIEI